MLDETYERILQAITEKKRKDAHGIFQWLTVSSRPLRVEELAEVFAINFDEEMSGIPSFDSIQAGGTQMPKLQYSPLVLPWSLLSTAGGAEKWSKSHISLFKNI